MWNNDSPVETLTPADGWVALRGSTLGRLAISVADEIDIFPINYYVEELTEGGPTLLFRTAPGTKLLELTVAGRVALEIDGHTDTDAWSVVVKGTTRQLDHQNEIDAADALPLVPWIPTPKYRYVRITPTGVSGRRFIRAAEPERY